MSEALGQEAGGQAPHGTRPHGRVGCPGGAMVHRCTTRQSGASPRTKGRYVPTSTRSLQSFSPKQTAPQISMSQMSLCLYVSDSRGAMWGSGTSRSNQQSRVCAGLV